MEFEFLQNGLITGLLATLFMTIFQIPIWKKWGIFSILQWHENQTLTSKLFNKSIDDSLLPSFAFHSLHGGLGGIGFAAVVYYFHITNYIFAGSVLGVLFTFILLLIHKPITGNSPFKQPLNMNPFGPFVISLISHLVYGLTLGYFLSILSI